MGRKPSDDPTTPLSIRMTAGELDLVDQLVVALGAESRRIAITTAVLLALRWCHQQEEKTNANP